MSRVVKLEELCLPDQIGKYGIPAVAEEFSEDKVRYLRITDIDDYGNLLENDKKSVSSPEIEKYILKEGDIVFARTGNSTGRTYYHEEKNGELAFAGFLIKFSIDESKVNPKYLKYFTISKPYKQWVDNLSNGSTRGNINAKTFADCPIILPSREQQDYLVRVLSSLEDKIQINNQINQELEAMAKTLYDYWFVQFDFPDQNGKPYKSSGGKMVYNPELKREIPEGWGVETLVDNTLSKVIKPGIDHFTQKTYLATGDVVNTSIKDGRLITFENRETRANMQPSVNSVWFAKMKSSNKHLFLSHSMKELIDSTILSTGFMGLRCKEESFEYIASFISDPNFEIFKDTLSHGATQEAVNIDDLRSVPVIIPDDYILREFHRIAKSIFLNLGRNMIEDKTLSSLHDWLLPMLMNGQVKVE